MSNAKSDFTKTALKPQTPKPARDEDFVFVPAYPGDKPDTDTSSMRGYTWVKRKPAPAPKI